MLNKAIDFLSEAVWGLPTVALILGGGLYFTLKTGFLQIRSFKSMLKSVRKNIFSKKNDNPLRTVSTALAATVGTGSITGVAAALTTGGAGAVFWLWVSAFFGMAVSYAEGVLSIKYKSGKKGGIMYAIRDGTGKPKTAAVYAVFTVLASFGMGSMAQTNSASSAMRAEFGMNPAVCGAFIAAIVAAGLFSRRDFTGRLCSAVIPALSLCYAAAAVIVIIKNIERVPYALELIFKSAFGLKAISGGAVGITVKRAVAEGFKRGVFSNEAGLGTTAAIHAETEGVTPHEQGLMNMFEVIIDTFVICTLTALFILCSGEMDSGAEGAALVTAACGTAFGSFSGKIAAVAIAGFAAATVLGWSKIGLAASCYLGSGQKPLYKAAFIISAFSGSVLNLDTVWKLSDIFNGLMIFPCMAALLSLRKEILSEHYIRPVEPKPFSPRRDSGKSSDSVTSGKITGVTTS